jgi:hypothetical protein
LPEQAYIGIDDLPFDYNFGTVLGDNIELSLLSQSMDLYILQIASYTSTPYTHMPSRFVAAESGIEFNRNGCWRIGIDNGLDFCLRA